MKGRFWMVAVVLAAVVACTGMCEEQADANAVKPRVESLRMIQNTNAAPAKETALGVPAVESVAWLPWRRRAVVKQMSIGRRGPTRTVVRAPRGNVIHVGRAGVGVATPAPPSVVVPLPQAVQVHIGTGCSGGRCLVR
jgi:hypothetical protein